MIKQNHPICKCPSMVFLVLKLALVGTSTASYKYTPLTKWRNEQILLYATYPAVILVAISMGHQHLGLAERLTSNANGASGPLEDTFCCPGQIVRLAHLSHIFVSPALDIAVFSIALFLALSHLLPS
jgi:hypothetical protein